MLSTVVLSIVAPVFAQLPSPPGKPVPFQRDTAIAFFDEVDCPSGSRWCA